MRSAVIKGIGHAVPDRIVTNDEIATLVDTSDEWIRQRTGIAERRVSGPDETASTLGTRAAAAALKNANVAATDIDLIVCGTVTGDMVFPSAACFIQEALGAKNAGAFDVGAACAGFIYSLSAACGMIRDGSANRALVIGSDCLTKYVDWTDRSTCVLFGDGAGAVVVEGAEDSNRGLIRSALMADGSGARFIDVKFGGSLYPPSDPRSATVSQAIYMAGAEVYRFAVQAMGDACCKVLELASMDVGEVDLFVPHQANLRIIESSAKRIGLPPEKVFVNVQKYGNTSGGSIPLALSEAQIEGRLKPGMVVMTVGFGAGLVWGANLIRW